MKALFNNTVYFSEMISENMPHSASLIFFVFSGNEDVSHLPDREHAGWEQA